MMCAAALLAVAALSLGCGAPAPAPAEPIVVVVPSSEAPSPSAAGSGAAPDEKSAHIARESAVEPSVPSPQSSSAPPAQGQAAAASTPPSSLAQARQLFQTGVAAYAQGDYAAATQAFRGAYSLVPNDKVLYNLAQAELKAKDKKAGCAHLQQYLQGADPNDQVTQQAAQNARQSCP